MRLILLGAPGAGKGTQAAFLKDRDGCVHVSTGDIFRKNLKEQTPLGLEAKQYMDKGALVPDEVTEKMVAARLQEPDAVKGFLLDGFPRTVPQAEFLEKFLNENGLALDAVLLFTIDDEKLVSRLSNRRTCRACGGIFNLITMDEAQAKSGKCPDCGGELFQRDDDNETVIRNRLKVFHDQTEPLVAWYKERGLLREISAEGAPEAIYTKVKAVLSNHAAS